VTGVSKRFLAEARRRRGGCFGVVIETELVPELGNRGFVAVAGQVEELGKTGINHDGPPALRV